MMVGNVVDREMNSISAGFQWAVLQLIVSIPTLITLASLDTSSSAVYRDFAAHCHFGTHGTPIDTGKYLDISGGDRLFWKSLGQGILIGIFHMVVRMYFHLYNINLHMLVKFIPGWLKKNYNLIFWNALLLVESSAALSEAIQVREALTSTKNAPAGGNKWGYGQSTAILLWLPFPVCILDELFS